MGSRKATPKRRHLRCVLGEVKDRRWRMGEAADMEKSMGTRVEAESCAVPLGQSIFSDVGLVY